MHQVKGGIGHVQVTPIVVPSTPVFSQTDHLYHQDVCFDNEFPQSSSTPGTQRAILSLSEIPQRGPSRGNPLVHGRFPLSFSLNLFVVDLLASII